MSESSATSSTQHFRRGTRTRLSYKVNEANEIRVKAWGRSTRQEIERIGNQVMQRVNYWDILWVDVYVRDFANIYSGYHGVKAWIFYRRYPVREWCDIRRVFDEYLCTAGLYARVSFHVEQWMWSMENEWEIDDQV